MRFVNRIMHINCLSSIKLFGMDRDRVHDFAQVNHTIILLCQRHNFHILVSHPVGVPVVAVAKGSLSTVGRLRLAMKHHYLKMFD